MQSDVAGIRRQKILAINFKNTLADLLQDLKDNVLTERDEQRHLATAIVAIENVEPSKICERSRKLALDDSLLESIRVRNKDFFVNETTIFQGLPENIVQKYKKILISDSRITDDVLNIIWAYVDHLVRYITAWSDLHK